MAEKHIADVFAIPDFWKPSTCLERGPGQGNGEETRFFSLRLPDEDKNPISQEVDPPGVPQDGFFKLPSLLKDLRVDPTDKQLVPDVEIDTNFDSSSAVDSDPWLLLDSAALRRPRFRTWEAFAQPEQENEVVTKVQPPTTFVTEAGPSVFDALLHPVSEDIASSSDDIINTAGYCVCLLALAMGRRSVLFDWDSAKNRFVKTISRARTSGFSSEALAGVEHMCLECANSINALRIFVDKTYSVSPSPSKIALADVVDKLLVAIQSELGTRGQKIKSVLQLQAAVKPVYSTLFYFNRLIDILDRAKSGEEIISLLFDEAQSVEYRPGLLRNTICEVLQMVSKPWTGFVEEWIGLKAEEGIVITKDGPGKSFIKVANKMWTDDQGFELEEPEFFFDQEKMPSFMPEDIALEIFETGRNLRFIRENHPEHPLSEPKVVVASRPPSLQWKFDWDAITKLEQRVKKYETALRHAIQERLLDDGNRDGPAYKNRATEGYKLQVFGREESQIAENILVSMANFDQPLAAIAGEDELISILRRRLFGVSDISMPEKEFTPHWSLLPLLSFGPIVAAQARLVNRECLKLLFSSHNLRTHLDLQRQYHLLGNGVFCSRLSHALFDPELDTAERQAGVALTGGNMGLRLNGRDNWPPASSELRLVLMGVLTDSYQARSARGEARTDVHTSQLSNAEIPGDLSFAVRDLSPEEIERCIDPDALQALDFLRLAYKSPTALRPILTPLILLKYDRIFQLLLRVLRMLYVANQLFRDVSVIPQSDSPVSDDAILRFRIESHHFITQISAYFFTTGVSRPWQRFETWLDGIEAGIVRTDGESEITGEPHLLSPDRLREYHEHVLDDIMLALLLRKRQGPVMKLLEDIFGVILTFAKMLRLRALGAEIEATAPRPEELYAKFRRRVEVFITVCKGLGEKSNAGSKSERRGEERVVEQGDSRSGDGLEDLLLRLDLSGYWARKPSS